jgi:hypothetical protein
MHSLAFRIGGGRWLQDLLCQLVVDHLERSDENFV